LAVSSPPNDKGDTESLRFEVGRASRIVFDASGQGAIKT
jgi:hypothetical protein